MECPNCGLLNPESAERCDCGYDFASAAVLSSYLTDKQREAAVPAPREPAGSWWMKRLGALAFAAALSLLLLLRLTENIRDTTGLGGFVILALAGVIGIAGLGLAGAAFVLFDARRNIATGLLFGSVGVGVGLLIGLSWVM